jgi:6-phosphogluconolactonase
MHARDRMNFPFTVTFRAIAANYSRRDQTMSLRSLAATVALISAATLASPARAASGAVYTMENAAGPNTVVVYSRASNGTLTQTQSVLTGGLGTGAGLGSQGSLALSEDGRWLLAVNAGSNDVTVFSVAGGELTAVGTQVSGGIMPISVTVHNNTVFVLNAGGTPDITGFHLTTAGVLVPIPSVQKVLTGTGPAEVSFNLDGTLVAVTEKTSNTIVVFSIDSGTLIGPFISASAGQEPFGFAFGPHNLLLVTEAFNAAQNGSAVSSYQADAGAGLRLITPSLSTTQTAACWLVITGHGRFAYAANAGSASISSYAVAQDGSLALINGVAGSTPAGTSPQDLALSAGSQYLYNLASGTISEFQVAADGSLTPIGSITGLPASTVGLQAQ